MRVTIDVLKNAHPIEIQYISGRFTESNTETEIYDTCKLTVLLTDDLVAILDKKLIGGHKGDILLFNPSEIHFGRFLRSGTYRFLELYIPFSFFDSIFHNAEDLRNLFTDHSNNRKNCLSGNVKEKSEIIEISEKIVTLITDYDPQKNIEIFSDILRILLISASLYRKPTVPAHSDDVTPTYILHAVTYIANHYSEKISVKDIAKELGCSSTYLSKLFQKYVGISVYNYVIEYRIHMAANLLKSDYSVTDVCYLTGFNDCSNFIEKFKQIIGTTPLKYKKLYIKN